MSKRIKMTYIETRQRIFIALEAYCAKKTRPLLNSLQMKIHKIGMPSFGTKDQRL